VASIDFEKMLKKVAKKVAKKLRKKYKKCGRNGLAR
jgi:predicted DNA-binding protein (UPF0278 family)